MTHPWAESARLAKAEGEASAARVIARGPQAIIARRRRLLDHEDLAQAIGATLGMVDQFEIDALDREIARLGLEIER